MLLLYDFITDTTKQRLEDLESQKKDLEQKVIVEEARAKYELTKEDIQNYFRHAMKQCPEMAFDLFIKFVKVYENKIEIGLNYSIHEVENKEPIIRKVFTETKKTERKFKGGNIKTKTQIYDVYVVI